MRKTFNVLAFFAHPDDETMLIGGTLALLAQAGASVQLVIATRGEGGEMGDPPVCTREELAQVREAELRCAAQALGAASLTLMNYIDPLIGPEDTLFAFTDNVDELAEQLQSLLQSMQVNALITHGVNGEYGHPAHQLVYQAAERAMQRAEQPGLLWYTVQGIFDDHPMPRLANEDTPAHLIIDVQPVLEQKTAAALCHRTQHALFVRHGSETAGRPVSVPEIIQPLESLHRVLPAADPNGEVQDPLADLLRASGRVRAHRPG